MITSNAVQCAVVILHSVSMGIPGVRWSLDDRELSLDSELLASFLKPFVQRYKQQPFQCFSLTLSFYFLTSNELNLFFS